MSGNSQRIACPGIPWASPTLLCIFRRRSLVEQTLGKLIPASKSCRRNWAKSSYALLKPGEVRGFDGKTMISSVVHAYPLVSSTMAAESTF